MTQTLPLVDEVRRARRLLEPATARAIRTGAHITQERLAREIGVDRTTLNRWESGATEPRGDQRERYAEILAGLEQAIAS